jgi:hypothetical protein
MKASFQYGLYGLSLLAVLAAGIIGSCKGTIVGEDDPGIDTNPYDPDSVVAVLELMQGHVEQGGPVDDPDYILVYQESAYNGALYSRALVAAIPDSFRQDGLAVVFSGEVHPAPPYARMKGDPFTITYIARREP